VIHTNATAADDMGLDIDKGRKFAVFKPCLICGIQNVEFNHKA